MVLSSERLKKLMGWSYAEVGWFQLEEMSTLSSVNQSQPKSTGATQYNAKSTRQRQRRAGPGKRSALSTQEPWHGYFFYIAANHSILYSHFVTETI